MASSKKNSLAIASYQRNGSLDDNLPSLDEGEEEVEVDDGMETMSASSLAEGDIRRYDWRLFVPAQKSIAAFVQWLVVGGANKASLPEEHVQKNLRSLARCIVQLREYADRFGMPRQGGPKDQEFVLREVFRDLYLGGAPVWALESVMQKAAEGLTGDPGVNWLLLPRKTFMSGSSLGTSMFKSERGFSIQKMDQMEKIATRLASFASNTKGFSNIPSRLPKHGELLKASRTASSRFLGVQLQDSKKVAKEILSLASRAEGLFFFINKRRAEAIKAEIGTLHPADDAFWTISEREQEVFSRLATIEAMETIAKLDTKPVDEYRWWLVMIFRIVASAGACGFWFGGSWNDMWIAGLLAVIVAMIGSADFLSRSERVIYETVASFIVGLTSGLVALQWPSETCYTAMALGGVLDLLQGFRVVYAIIEIMSKNTVCGGSNLLEGVLFTGLIAYFLQFGQYCAAVLMHKEQGTRFSPCSNGISEYWYFLLVPAAALSWSGLFSPQYGQLPWMGFHGVLAYAVSWALTRAGVNENLNNFVSAGAVTFSAGLVSRFTGRQAVGNAVAGLYSVLPGAYLVRSISSVAVNDNFFVDIIQKAVVIGMGSWTGTILCSPTVLGTTTGILHQQVSGQEEQPKKDAPHHRRDKSSQAFGDTMLFF